MSFYFSLTLVKLLEFCYKFRFYFKDCLLSDNCDLSRITYSSLSPLKVALPTLLWVLANCSLNSSSSASNSSYLIFNLNSLSYATSNCSSKNYYSYYKSRSFCFWARYSSRAFWCFSLLSSDTFWCSSLYLIKVVNSY